MRMLNKFQNFVFMAGAVLLLAGAAIYPTDWLYAFYMYAVGACAFAAMQDFWGGVVGLHGRIHGHADF